jgi:hypothetical protein
LQKFRTSPKLIFCGFLGSNGLRNRIPYQLFFPLVEKFALDFVS